MKCPNCNYSNEEDSKFCQGCGHRLEKVQTQKVGHTKSGKHNLVDELDDIIFTPKKDAAGWGWVLIALLLVAAVAVWAGVYLTSPNEAQKAKMNSSSSDELTSCIELTEAKLYGSYHYTDSEPNPTYVSNIHNACGKPVSNVVVKIDFFKGYDTEYQSPDDTQYINAFSHLDIDETRIINTTVSTIVDTTGDFQYKASVYSAEVERNQY